MLYLKNLNKKFDNGTLNPKNLNMHIPTVVDSLMKHPELIEQCTYFLYSFEFDFAIWSLIIQYHLFTVEPLALKFSKANILTPVNSLWIYYFLQKNPKADEIWINNLQSSEEFAWPEVITLMQSENDPSLYVNLAQLLKQSSLLQMDKLMAFSRLIESCIALGMYKSSRVYIVYLGWETALFCLGVWGLQYEAMRASPSRRGVL